MRNIKNSKGAYALSMKAVRAETCDANIDKFPTACCLRWEIDHLVSFIPSGIEVGSSLARAKAKDFQNPAYLAAVVFELDLSLQVLDFFKPCSFFLPGDIVFELCCPR